MKKLLLFILLIPAWVQAQNYSPTAPAGSSPATMTIRTVAGVTDSLLTIYGYVGGKYYKIPTGVQASGLYKLKTDSLAGAGYTTRSFALRFVPYDNWTKDVTAGNHSLSLGTGYYSMSTRTGKPTGVSGEIRMYRDSAGSFAYQNGPVRRTFRVRRSVDNTITYPWKINPTLVDSTEVALGFIQNQTATTQAAGFKINGVGSFINGTTTSINGGVITTGGLVGGSNLIDFTGVGSGVFIQGGTLTNNSVTLSNTSVSGRSLVFKTGTTENAYFDYNANFFGKGVTGTGFTISSAPTNRTDLSTGSVTLRNSTTGNIETVSGSYFVPSPRTVAGFALSSDVTLAGLSGGYGISMGTYNGSTGRTITLDTATIGGYYMRLSGPSQTTNATTTFNKLSGTSVVTIQAGTSAAGSSSNIAELDLRTVGAGGGYFNTAKLRQYTDGTNGITELSSGSTSSLYPILLNGGSLNYQTLGNLVWTDDRINANKGSLSVFSTNTTSAGVTDVYTGDLFAMPVGTMVLYNTGSATNSPTAQPGTIRQYYRDANIRSLRYEDILGNAWVAQTTTYPTGLSWVQVGTSGGTGYFVTTNTSQNITADKTILLNGIGTTVTMGFGLQNSTAGIVGTTVQRSPDLLFSGQAYNTTSTTSNPIEFRLGAVPTSGASTSGILKIAARFNGGSSTDMMAFTSVGDLRAYVDGRGLANPTPANALFAPKTAGPYIERNVSSGVSLTVNSVNASNTDNISEFQWQGATKAGISNVGTIFSTNTITIGAGAPVSGRLSMLQATNTISGGIILQNSASTGATRIWVDDSDNSRISGNSTENKPVIVNGGGTAPLLVNTTTNDGVNKLQVNGGATATGLNLTGLTASRAVFTDGSKNMVSNATTGTGNVVMSASPALTGTPTAPTASAGTNTTQIATTAFVQANAGGSSTRVVYSAYTDVNSTAGTTNVYSYTIPANTLQSNGQLIEGFYSGRLATQASSSRAITISIQGISGTSIPIPNTIAGSDPFTLVFQIFRTGTTTARLFAKFQTGVGSVTIQQPVSDLTGLDFTTTAALTAVVTGVTASDITFNTGYYKFNP